MKLLQRIIDHFQNLVLVSDISIKLINLSIIILSVAYVYAILFKNNKYEKVIVKIGVLIRVLMLIGFTIEFSYQRNICKGNPLVDGKYNAIEQFTNYIFFAYLFVIGIYDIFTIGIDEFRGFFHTFDLTIISMPILYGLTASIMDFTSNKDVKGLIIVASLFILPLLFFKLYWKQNFLWYSIFFIYVSGLLILYRILKYKNLVMFTLICYLLIGIYELSRHLFNSVRKISSPALWRKFKIISIILPVMLIYFCMVVLNILPLNVNKKYKVKSVYRENATFTSLQDAEKLARTAVNDSKSFIGCGQSTWENFNNRYTFSVDNYSVTVDGASGKIVSLVTKKETNVKGKEILSESHIREKTLKWLKSVGFTFDDSHQQLKIEKQNERYVSTIYNKYSDGSVEEQSSGEIQWYLDGRLLSAYLGFSNLKDYKDIKVDEVVIGNNIAAWYNKLGEKAPSYEIERFNYWFGDRVPSINIKCKNKDTISINSYNGNIICFNSNKESEIGSEINKELHEQYRYKAEDMARSLSCDWSKFNFKADKQADENNKEYNFAAESSYLINYINIRLDSKGNMISFQQSSLPNFKFYSEKNFKVSSKTALKKVSKQYNFGQIYAKRVELAAQINYDDKVNYKWMVIVIPFKSAEHQIYYVDADTGKIKFL